MAHTQPPHRPLRTLFVVARLEPGGAEGSMVQLALRAHPERLDASVATLYPTSSRRHLDRLSERGIPVTPLTSGRNRLLSIGLAVPRLRRLIAAERPDVVYAWLEEAALVAVPAARGPGVPVAVARQSLGGAISERYPPVRMAVRRVEAAAALVTANSGAVRDGAAARGIAPERVRVVLNGHERVDPLPMPTAPPVRLACVANLRPEKGHKRLFAALSLLDTQVDWHVELAGSGPLEEELRGEVAARGLEQRVSFLGRVSDIRALWARCHVAVLVSDHEGSPNALVEAAMAGRPIVATAVGGTPEVVEPGGGLLVPPDDPRAIAAALERMIDDPELRARCGTAAYAQAVERYSMERFVDGGVGALAEAAATGGRAAA